MGAPQGKYSTSIELRLVVPIGHDYDEDLMRRQVDLVNAAHPWVCHGNECDDNWVSPDIRSEQSDLWDHRTYSIEIRSAYLLTRDQAYAFERYGDRLAKGLAAIVSKDVLGVNSSVKIVCNNSNYRPPSNI